MGIEARITADMSAPNNQQAIILETANGRPQVNIQTPSSGGVSRNTFSQFDVDNNGAIINNSRKLDFGHNSGLIILEIQNNFLKI
jgi:filamentous hemagglutinin